MITKSERNSVLKYIKKAEKTGELPFKNNFLAGEMERGAWEYFFYETTAILSNDDDFESFDTRSKMFAFYYTFIEVIKENRTFVKLLSADKDPYIAVSKHFSTFEDLFKNLVSAIYVQGNETGEIAVRTPVKKVFLEMLVQKLRWIVRTWISDNSEDYEKTDAAIEKAVHLTFDILQPNMLDSGFEFAKFLLQQKKK